METNTPVTYYYDLFKFFSEQYGLTLLGSEIQEIISEVEKFKEAKYEEAQKDADWQLQEDDDWELSPDDTCLACGYEDGNHMKGCPEDDSPFAQLCRDGYD